MRAPSEASAALFSNTTIDFKKLYPKLSLQIPTVTTTGDTTIQAFDVNPASGKLISFGKNSGHVVAIPANTLCDPTLTGYGPTQ